jgi:hypothetical protein
MATLCDAQAVTATTFMGSSGADSAPIVYRMNQRKSWVADHAEEGL